MIETNRTYKVEVAQGQTFMDQIQFVDENNTPFDWTQLITAEDRFEDRRQAKLSQLSASFKAHVSGSFICSFGYPMQFNESDSLKMEGAIQLLNASGEETGYITDAEDVSHWDITTETMEIIKLEMLAEFAKAHRKKQLLRQEILDAETQEELDLIQW